MIDQSGRSISYMRISITDRCNLRCQYCMPDEFTYIDHENILRYEEILEIAKVAIKLGITHFKITGGEPLVREGFLSFFEQMRALSGIETISITTNGVLLGNVIGDLAKIGIDGVNISLDTLNSVTYKKLTKRNVLQEVLASFDKTVSLGVKTKINCVPMQGINDHELSSIVNLGKEYPVDIRFIELMPTTVGKSFSGISGKQVLERIKLDFPDLIPTNEQRGFGPARYYRSNLLQGRVGFIDVISNHFCDHCNRVRITSEGFLKLCLYHQEGILLREMIRSGSNHLEEAMRSAIENKPDRHHFTEKNIDGGIYKMSGIGG